MITPLNSYWIISEKRAETDDFRHLTMRYANKSARKATLIIEGNRVPVLVDAQEVINIRDRRSSYEGRFWSTEMPVLASMKSIEEPLSLEFANNEIMIIRIISRCPTQIIPASNPGLWDFFEAYFISEKNIGKV